MKEKYSIVELFSGIGSQRKALENLGIETQLQATCEWDVHAFAAYAAIHEAEGFREPAEVTQKDEICRELGQYSLSNDGKNPASMKLFSSYGTEALSFILYALKQTRNLVNVSDVRGAQMPDRTDILTYSFPCQDLSNVGAFHGYRKGIDRGSGSRSSLLWEVGRILSEMRSEGKSLPRYLVMENVPTLLSDRHIGNFKLWIKELDELGYVSKYVPVNARNYGLPQNRPRLLMMSVYAGEKIGLRREIEVFFDGWGNDESRIVSDFIESGHYRHRTVRELLNLETDRRSPLWEEALECTPNDTESRRKIWEENPKIVDENGRVTDNEFIRTITTKQDRHPNSGNVYFDSGIPGRSKFRYLTPRECLRFMGFTDGDYENIRRRNYTTFGKNVLFPRDKIIRMAGNSIPVMMLEGFFYQLHRIEPIVESY